MSENTPPFGKLPPQYRFALSPFVDVRWSRCPLCDRLTHSRKFPLLIHIEGGLLLTLGKTCRYCTPCEFIIADRAELEGELVIACEQRGRAEKVGSPYWVLGTVKRGYWKDSLKRHGQTLDDLRLHAADIKEYYQLPDPRRVWTPTGTQAER